MFTRNTQIYESFILSRVLSVCSVYFVYCSRFSPIGHRNIFFFRFGKFFEIYIFWKLYHIISYVRRHIKNSVWIHTVWCILVVKFNWFVVAVVWWKKFRFIASGACACVFWFVATNWYYIISIAHRLFKRDSLIFSVHTSEMISVTCVNHI